MAVDGFQRYFRPGAEIYFRRAPINGVTQPIINLGTIKSVTPKIEEETVKLMNARSGRKKQVDQRTVSRSESYDVKTNNLCAFIMSLIFSALAPVRTTRTLVDVVTEQVHGFIRGHLIPLYYQGKRAYNLNNVAAVTSTTKRTITAVNTDAKTITVGTTNPTEIVAGRTILLRQNNELIDMFLTVADVTFDDPDYIITVEEDIDGMDVSGTAALAYVEGTDWEETDAMRGMIKILPDSSLLGATGNVAVDFSISAHDEVTMYPGSDFDTVTGYAELHLKDDAGELLSREMEVSVTRGGMTTGVKDYSEASLMFDVIENPGEARPAGRLVQFAGTIEDGV